MESMTQPTEPEPDRPGATRNGALTPRQYAAIAALVQGNSVTAAADVAKCGRRTLCTWLTTEGFRAALAEAERGVVEEACRRLTALSAKALDAIEAILDDEEASDTDRLRAASLVLSQILNLRESVAVEARIQALEEAVPYA